MISRLLRTRSITFSPLLFNLNTPATFIFNENKKNEHNSAARIGADGIIHSEFPPVAVQDRSFNETFTEAIWRNGIEQPTRPALINAENPSDQVTYPEIFLKIYSAASYLNSIRFTNGDVATVLLPNSWQYLIIFGSVTMQGGCMTGLNPLSTDYELQHAFFETNCKVIFLPDILLDRIWEVAQECPHVEKLIIVPSSYPPTEMPNNLPDKVISFVHVITQFPAMRMYPTHQIDAHKDLAFLPFSSGTTGPPKAVMLTHQNIGTMARIFNHHLDHQIVKKMDPDWDWRNEHQLVVLPFYHIYGFILGINVLLSGSTGILLRRFELDLFCKTIQDYKIKFVCVVPPILVALAKSRAVKRYDLSSLRFIITGAAPTGRDLCDEVMKAIPSVEQIAQGYGMTEESMASHLPVFGMNNPVAAGRLASNFEMKIMDVDKGKPVPLYQRGEIWCRGPTIMKGYLNKAELTAETIDKDGWLKTGDVGYHDDAGWTHVVDRLKELIKVKAFQVAPAELEDLLLSYSAIRDCAVIGIPDRSSGEIPKAFVVRRDELLTEHDVKEFVKSKVANYKQIRAVQFVDEIPKSASGKILRRMLKEIYCS